MSFRAAVPLSVIESAMQTGDLILYDCERLIPVPTRERHLLHAVTVLENLCTALPCAAYAAMQRRAARECVGEHSVLDDDWSGWQHAALVIRLPTDVSAVVQDNSPTVPFVLAVSSEEAKLVLLSISAFLDTVDSQRCAWRQLVFEAPGVSAAQATVLSGQRRDFVLRRISTFYDQLCIQTPQPDTDVTEAVCALLHTRSEIDCDSAADERELALADLMPLLVASPAYLVLYTLYKINLVNTKVAARHARSAVQVGGALEAMLCSNAVLSDPMLVVGNQHMLH